MAEGKTDLVTREEAEALASHIGTTIRKLMDVLLVNNVISIYDVQYVRGQVDKEEWLAESTKSPADLFTELLKSYENRKSEDGGDIDEA